MARALAELGCPVFYHEPITPSAPDVRSDDQRHRAIGIQEISPNVCLVRSPKVTVKDLVHFCTFDAVVMSWPWQAKWFSRGSRAFLIYEMVDHHSLDDLTSTNDEQLHRQFLKEADLVVATADDLLNEVRKARPDALLVPNAVRLEDWTISSDEPLPLDMIRPRQARIVVGYIGAIASWFDWPLWESLSTARPDWAFVLIGYAADNDGQKYIDRAKQLTNVHYLGAKPHDTLKSYVGNFDVATIPFRLNSITHACSPLKLFEYIACGKPVVATPMREIKKYPLVRVGDNAAKFLEEIENAVKFSRDKTFTTAASEHAEHNTWRARAALLLKKLQDVQRAQGNIPRRFQIAPVAR